VSNIDKQRIAAVRKLEELGYTFAGEWMHPANDASLAILVPAVTDPSMHCSYSELTFSKAVGRAQSRRPNWRASSTQSRPMKRSAGPRAKSREGKGGSPRQSEGLIRPTRILCDANGSDARRPPPRIVLKPLSSLELRRLLLRFVDVVARRKLLRV